MKTWTNAIVSQGMPADNRNLERLVTDPPSQLLEGNSSANALILDP